MSAASSPASSLAPRPARTRLLLVGERRSATAERRGWTWRDGRLAAAPLFEALRACGVDPTDASACSFINLWLDGDSPVVPRQRVAVIRVQQRLGVTIVALGRRVAGELARRAIPHVAITHPAARGRIHRRDRYVAHVRDRLGGVVGAPAVVECAGAGAGDGEAGQ